MKDVIKVQKLSKSYGGKTAVAEVSLTVSGGMVFGLLGANGAGKSYLKKQAFNFRKLITRTKLRLRSFARPRPLSIGIRPIIRNC